MDEIWSLELVRELHSAFGVFTQTHHDNNHYLNNLFIYFLGQHGDWPGYRIPAEVFGIGTIVLAWLIGARRDRWAAFFCMFLVSFSYVLILYSSEARGYAPLIFFCFLCLLVLHSFFDKPRWQSAALFSLSTVLGLTSHLTFVIFLCASLLWFWVRLLKLKWSILRVAAWTAACYAAPFIYFVALYVVDLRYLQIGGGTPIRSRCRCSNTGRSTTSGTLSSRSVFFSFCLAASSVGCFNRGGVEKLHLHFFVYSF